uniref:Uncharacterized protein n=1 Tax=Oryzias latipes TaxID=8090 RepID=A0A3P9HWN8_ORYLA
QQPPCWQTKPVLAGVRPLMQGTLGLSHARRTPRSYGLSPEDGISPVCMRAWRCSVLPWLKLFPQASQEKSFSPVCVRMWMVRWLLLLKRLPQVWQGKGLSPVCVRVCRSSVLLWLKHLPQTWQEPLLWQKRLPHTLQTSFPQILQEKGFSPVWIMMWFLNTEDCEKLFPQVLHR